MGQEGRYRRTSSPCDAIDSQEVPARVIPQGHSATLNRTVTAKELFHQSLLQQPDPEPPDEPDPEPLSTASTIIAGMEAEEEKISGNPPFCRVERLKHTFSPIT